MRRLDLLGVGDLADGEMRIVVVDGTDQVLVINQGGDFTATQGVCSHEYFELDKGFLTAGTLTCALHLSRFDLSSGEPLDPPAELPLEIYPVVVENGRVLRHNMRKELVTNDELEQMLRVQGIEDVAEIKAAYLESDGELSVIKREKGDDASPPKRRKRKAAA